MADSEDFNDLFLLTQANQANLKGEGKLEQEGVRPQRYAPGAQQLGLPATLGVQRNPSYQDSGYYACSVALAALRLLCDACCADLE